MWDIVFSFLYKGSCIFDSENLMILNCHNGEILVPLESLLDWPVHTSTLNPGQLIVLNWKLQA